MKSDVNSVFKSFAKPDGPLGELVGHYMAIDNQPLNLWAISVLDIQQSDRILEVGFGPGLAVEEMAKQASQGFVAGVDPSEPMFEMAQQRNAKAIQQGQVDLRLSDALALPLFETTFDKILAVSSIMHWEKPFEVILRLKSILKPGGMIVIALQRTEEGLQKLENQQQLSRYATWVKQAGFCNIQALAHPIIKPTVIFPMNPQTGLMTEDTAGQTPQIQVDPTKPIHMIGICLVAYTPTAQE